VSFIDEMFDESELLSDDDKAALDAEERGETYEAQPAAPAELVREKEQLSRQLAEERERFVRLDERRRAAEEADAPRYAHAPQGPPSRLGPRPDVELDPWGADVWDARRETELLQHRVEQDQADRQQQEFTRWIEDDTDRFRARHADYDQAANHAYQWRVKYWMDLGRPEAVARGIVDQEAAATAMMARQSGKSVAQHFYDLAKQVGYKAGPPTAVRQRQSAVVVRQRQASARELLQPQTRRQGPPDLDQMSESDLEGELRRDPRRTISALERLAR
jgi:hypothetical protein